MNKSETTLIESVTTRMVELRLMRMREVAEKTTRESKGSAVRAVVKEHEEEQKP